MSLPIASRFAGAKYRIEPTGNPVTDTPAFEKLLMALPMTGGVIEIADNGQTLQLNQSSTASVNSNGIIIYAGTAPVPTAVWVNKPLFIVGESQSSRIALTSYVICFGGNPTWWVSSAAANLTHGTFASAQALATQITGSTVPLTRGDWVLLWADDAIADVNPHNAGGSQRPASLHRIEYSYTTGDPATTYQVIDGHLPDTLSVSPKITKIAMLRNCGIANLTLSSTLAPDLGSGSVTQSLRVFGCVGFRMENVLVDDSSAGQVAFDACADTVVSNYSGLSAPRNAVDYAMVIQTVNGLTYQDSFWHNTRHVVTTGGSQPTGTLVRYGTPLGVTVRNVTNYQAGNSIGSGLTAFDTHSEGLDVLFEGCRVFGGGRHITQGFSARARRTMFRNCQFISGTTPTYAAGPAKNENKGFMISCSRSVIDNCTVRGAWRGVWYTTVQAGYYQDTHLCRNTVFENVTSNPIYAVEPMDGITVSGCTAINCATQYNGDEQTPQPNPIVMGAIVNLRNGTGHKVVGNQFERAANTYSLAAGNLTPSDIVFEANHVRGYTATYSSGTNKIGVRGDAGDPKGVSTTSGPAFQSTYSAGNYTS